MNMTPVRLAIQLLLLVHLCGTAEAQSVFGQTADYRGSWPSLDVSVKSQVSVLVIDERPYVVSGDKKDTFVGLLRNLYGMPFDIHTASKLPLARDLEEAIVNGLQNSGITANAVATSGRANRKADSEQGKLLVITLNEWKSGGYTGVSFAYAVSADVYSQHGKVLGSQSVIDRSTVPSAIDAGRDALTALLTSVSISQALSALVVDESGAQVSGPDVIRDTSDIYTDLKNLKDLLDTGAVTQDEFDAQKKKLLAK